MVEMNLVEVRANKLFAQLMRLAANERHLQPSKNGDQELCRAVGIEARVGVRRLHLAQCARGNQQPMRVLRHEAKTFDKGTTFDCTGMDQIREVLPL